MKKNKIGSIYIEVLLAIVVFTMLVLSVVPLLNFILKRTGRSKYEPQATALLQEAMEGSYNVLTSTNNWNQFILGSSYKLAKTATNKWHLSVGSETNIETRFSRNIIFSQVCRDNNGYSISPDQIQNGNCPGTTDPDSRMITVTIEWQEVSNTKQLSSSLLVTNLQSIQ